MNLKEHIDTLKEMAKTDPLIDAYFHYFLLLIKDHYIAINSDSLHFKKGESGFVDSTGNKLTEKEFLKAIETPEPPEPIRKWINRAQKPKPIQGLFEAT
jgi:hypothetical protein